MRHYCSFHQEGNTLDKGRSENVVSSLQVAKMVEKIERMLKCVENKIREDNPDAIHPTIRLDWGFDDF